MTTFDEREQAFEAKYAHDEEMQFKARARRNKLAGLWAAELLGKTGADAEAYALEIVKADLEEAGDVDVVARLMKDLSNHVDEATIRSKLADLMAEAKAQILSEG
ncbi:MAG: DUF1476 domain-containing protein [Alphaproteobacteria bacterium]|nr:MAG: DUF1476 domain-containing protein [Alphaproteobacteria bacterium]